MLPARADRGRSLKLEGREKALAKLRAIPQTVRPALRASIEGAAGEVVAFQQRVVPVKSGKLRKSIRYVMGSFKTAGSAQLRAGSVEGDPDLTATIIAGDQDGWYARLVEFGTKPHSLAKDANRSSGKYQDQGRQHPGSAARPFFYGPFRALRKKLKRKISTAVRKAALAAVKG